MKSCARVALLACFCKSSASLSLISRTNSRTPASSLKNSWCASLRTSCSTFSFTTFRSGLSSNLKIFKIQLKVFENFALLFCSLGSRFHFCKFLLCLCFQKEKTILMTFKGYLNFDKKMKNIPPFQQQQKCTFVIEMKASIWGFLWT